MLHELPQVVCVCVHACSHACVYIFVCTLGQLLSVSFLDNCLHWTVSSNRTIPRSLNVELLFCGIQSISIMEMVKGRASFLRRENDVSGYSYHIIIHTHIISSHCHILLYSNILFVLWNFLQRKAFRYII